MIKKLATGLTAGAMLLSTALPALAGSSMDWNSNHNDWWKAYEHGNAQQSKNNINIDYKKTFTITQSNDAHVFNSVNVWSNTGGLSGDGNNKGDVYVKSGDSNTTIHVVNDLNHNYYGN